MFSLAFQPFFAAPPGPAGILSDNVDMTSVEAETPSDSINKSTEALLQRLAELEEHVRSQTQGQPTQFLPQPIVPKEPKIDSPSHFKGNKAEAEEFVLKCDSIFDICRRTYHDEKTKLAFVFNLLEGDAYQWLKPALLSNPKPAWVTSWKGFQVEFLKNWADSDIKETSRQKLKSLRQTSSASAYATEFKKYAMYLSWSDEALRQSFFDGLRIDVQDRLLSPQRFSTFADLVESSIEWDNLLYQRRRAHPNTRAIRNTFATARDYVQPATVTSHRTIETSVKGPWPMDVNTVQPRKPLTQAEKDERRKKNLCLYCGKPGHRVQDCRAKPSTQKVSAIQKSSTSENDNPHQ